MTYPHGEPGSHLTLEAEQQERQRAKYPAWVCEPCGSKYGHRTPTEATYHAGRCDVCGNSATVTEPRDYGHLKPGWENERTQ